MSRLYGQTLVCPFFLKKFLKIAKICFAAASATEFLVNLLFDNESKVEGGCSVKNILSYGLIYTFFGDFCQ
jgi:hypothetical protein